MLLYHPSVFQEKIDVLKGTSIPTMTFSQSSNQVLLKISKLDDSYVTLVLVKKRLQSQRNMMKRFSHN